MTATYLPTINSINSHNIITMAISPIQSFHEHNYKIQLVFYIKLVQHTRLSKLHSSLKK